MSYTKSFTSTVTVSGVKTVSYPASQNGGSKTVSYSETVPVQINITVDTDPFDSSIDQSAAAAKAMTGAIAVMNGAQCAQITAGAEKVSQRISSGFFKVINSSISMQKAENWNLLQAKSGLLLEIAKAIEDKHTRMNEDLQRVRKHFTHIFSGLDEDCEKRIRELDKQAFRLGSEIHRNIIGDSQSKYSAVSFCGMQEESADEERITAARLRKNASSVINTLADSYRDTQNYKALIAGMTYDTQVRGKCPEYIPVMYLAESGAGCSIYMPEYAGEKQISETVRSTVNGAAPMQWRKKTPEEAAQISRYFDLLVNSNSGEAQSREYTDRVNAIISRFWQNDRDRLKNL